MQVARADRRPGIIDQHDFAMDVDIISTTRRVVRGNSDKREAFVSAERRHLMEERLALRVAAGRPDVRLRIGWDQNDDLDPAF